MQAAAFNFGAPRISRPSVELLSCSIDMVILEAPRDCEEAKAMATRYQIKYQEALQAANEQRKEIFELKPDAEAYRKRKTKQRQDGKQSGGKRYPY